MNFIELELNNVIREVIDYRGKTPKKLGGNWSSNGIRALSAKNIKTGKIVQEETIRYVNDDLYKKWMKQEVEKGTILITSEAPFGEIFYWNSEEKIVLSQRIFGIKIKDSYNPEYIYYYMITKNFQAELNSRATGSTVTGLRQPELLKCKIKAPDRNVQDKIVKILSNIDKKIYLNTQINNNLYKVANTLLLNDFEENTDTEILSNIIKFAKGKKPLSISNNKEKDYLEYLTIACLNNQEITYANAEKTITSNNDILMVMDGASSGEVYFSNYGIVGSTLARVDIINEDYIKEYIFFVLKKYSELIKNKNTGSAIPHADKAFVNTLELPIISIEKQLKYKNILKKIQHNNKEVVNLIHIRDTLLPKLMNGEIDLDKIGI